ncbi:hypothetical protein GCM10010123_16880 [Pilimelia anulata]|uniref:Uncharacterized protein n=1 Tax=Pilimelia anulata TaxID=53371 RepID=A0A8J3F8C9_9ACTN|nr:hypothetical protein [Pilimelia anulata]GGJ87914.1 hypothetical protein GCM10010123_16880 [Pilimelia anulata]
MSSTTAARDPERPPGGQEPTGAEPAGGPARRRRWWRRDRRRPDARRPEPPPAADPPAAPVGAATPRDDADAPPAADPDPPAGPATTADPAATGPGASDPTAAAASAAPPRDARAASAEPATAAENTEPTPATTADPEPTPADTASTDSSHATATATAGTGTGTGTGTDGDPATSTGDSAAGADPAAGADSAAAPPLASDSGSAPDPGSRSGAPEGSDAKRDGPAASTATGTTRTATADTTTADTTTADPASKDAGAADAGTGTESDPFAAFAPPAARPPGRLRRFGRAAARVVRHEWTVAALVSVATAAALTWPTLRHPTRTLPQDTVDPALQAWQLAWSGHALTTDPGGLWNGNGFFPERLSYAFSDTLLGYAPFGLLGEGPAAAVLRYNIVFVLAHALALFGAYALVRQLGAGRAGGAIAGLAFAFAPWRLAQAGHLQVVSTGGIVLALAMLARGHGWALRRGHRFRVRRPGWALAGWMVAAWQLSLGFGVGLPFGYLMLLAVLVTALCWLVARIRRAPRHPWGWRLLLADGVGGLVFAGVGVGMAIPYFLVAAAHPYARRTADLIDLYSPPARSLLIAPGESLLWGPAHAPLRADLGWAPEMTLLPGFTLYALAATGLLYSVWTVRQRLLLLAGAVVTAVLALGTQFLDGRYTYLPLLRWLPGWDGLRAPGRLILWTTLFLAILAAGGISAVLGRAARMHPTALRFGLRTLLRFATVLPVLVLAVECLNTVAHPRVPRPPAALRDAPSPVLVLPSDFTTDSLALLWSTDGFPRLVNGNSGFTPESLARTREAVAGFPDAASVANLRSLGVRSVVVLPDRLPGTPWANLLTNPNLDYSVQRTDTPGATTFRLN